MPDEQEVNQPAASSPQPEPTMKTSLIAGLAMAYSAMGTEKLFAITEYLRNPMAQQHLQWLAEFIHSQTLQAIRRVEDVHDIADSLNILDAQCVVIDHLLAMSHMTPEMLGNGSADTDLGGSDSVGEEKAEFALIAPFMPAPLIELLKSEGFGSSLERRPDGSWAVSFWRP